MMLSDRERCGYAKSPLIETICQIRFPEILSIGTKDPADFQEIIRNDFPKYAKLREQAAPKLVSGGTPQAHFETPQATINHQFLSLDGKWKINMTTGFIALSTLQYPGWEEFAKRLDKVIAGFIGVYRPACFERMGLRYINGISRKELGLEGRRWSELINPAYLGVMALEDVREENVLGSTVDNTVNISGAVVKMRVALADYQKKGTEKEKRLILDEDVSMSGNLELAYTAGTLSSMHLTAKRAFAGAITDVLHNAMEPHEV